MVMKNLLLKKIVLAVSVMLSFTVWAQKPEFNADSAYAHVRHLTEDIGPRPMGSRAEGQALKWAAETFAQFGADTAYVMPFFQAPGGVNTTSGVAVGVFPGRSDSIIVVGGHIDSDSRFNPGASDTASGTACVMELARIWSKVPNPRYTMIFAAFGGEERGLVGSKYFVSHFQNIDKVLLMFSIDMASSRGWLIPFIDTKTHQAPRWLVEDAYAVDRAMGYNSLDYPTHFFALNTALGGAGSDHLPFLDKKIPAIDFTAGINYDPIHTPLDRLEFVDKTMLARSGKIVDALLEKYQKNGIPSVKTGNYLLLETFLGRQFIPSWMLFGLVLIGIIAGFGSILQARKFSAENKGKGYFSGVKIFLMMIVIAVFAQLGEAMLQWIKGTRYPWLTYFDQYLIYAAIWGVVGVWVALQSTRIWRMSEKPFGYAVRAAVLLLLYTGALFVFNARLALYPAMSLVLLYLAINLRPAILQLVVALLVPLPMFRLMFMETLPFIARSMTLAGFQLVTFKQAFFYSAALTALLTLWYLPTLFTWAYMARYMPSLTRFLEQFRKPITGLVLLFVVVGYGGYLAGLPAFSERWQPIIRAEAKYDINTHKAEMVIRSNDYLKNVRIEGENLQRLINQRILADTLDVVFLAEWYLVTIQDSVAIGEKDTVFVSWHATSYKPWHRLSFTAESDSNDIEAVIETTNYKKTKDGKIVSRWEADPAERISFTGRFIVPSGAKLHYQWKATYPELPMRLKVSAEQAVVGTLTEVTYIISSGVMMSSEKGGEVAPIADSLGTDSTNKPSDSLKIWQGDSLPPTPDSTLLPADSLKKTKLESSGTPI
jgi:hypothetical protein